MIGLFKNNLKNKFFIKKFFFDHIEKPIVIEKII